MGLVTGLASDLLTVSRASSGMRYNSAGVMESVGADLMRFDHDPVTKERLGVLIEGQRTNTITQSLNPAAWAWSGSASGKPSIFSGKSAREFVGSGLSSEGVTSATLSYPGSSSVCIWVIAEQGTALRVDWGLYQTSPGNLWLGLARYTWATGTITHMDGSVVSSGVVNLGTGPSGAALRLLWCVVGTASSTTQQSIIYPNGISSNTASTIIHARQGEAGLFPSSPIDTGASQVTRAADNITLARSAIPYDDTRVSITVEANWGYGSDKITAGRAALQIGGSVGNDRILVYNPDSLRGTVWMNAGGVEQCNLHGDVASADFVKLAARIGTNNARRAGGGVLGTADTSVIMPASPTTLRFGSVHGGESSLFGHIKRVVIVPRLWSDAELIARSTP